MGGGWAGGWVGGVFVPAAVLLVTRRRLQDLGLELGHHAGCLLALPAGVNVRHRAKEILQLVNSPDRLREEREKVRRADGGSSSRCSS